MKKKKYNVIKEVKRSARDVIGRPSKGKKTGAHLDRTKEADKNECRKTEKEIWAEVVPPSEETDIPPIDDRWHSGLS